MFRLLIALCALLASCGSVPAALDVIADRATYDAVAPEYLARVDAAIEPAAHVLALAWLQLHLTADEANRPTVEALIAHLQTSAPLSTDQKLSRHDTAATWDLRIRRRESALSGGGQ